ncbi:MAG TPA: fluoride efflux transporter CrcB [Pseudomonadales bacterium]
MSSTSLYLAIAAGGASGACARYALSLSVSRLWPGSFAAGTLAVNVLGALLIGVLFVLIHDRALLPESLKPLLVTGLLGGFTTFSAFSLETAGHLLEGQYGQALLYAVLSVSLCVLATLAGITVTRLLFN